VEWGGGWGRSWVVWWGGPALACHRYDDPFGPFGVGGMGWGFPGVALADSFDRRLLAYIPSGRRAKTTVGAGQGFCAEGRVCDEEVGGGVDVDDTALGVDEALAAGAEEGVGAGRSGVDFEHEGGAGGGDDAAVGDVGGGEVLAAVDAVVEDVALPRFDVAGARVDAGGPPRVVFAGGGVALDTVGAGGVEEIDGAINEAGGTDGDVGVEDDDGGEGREVVR